MKTFILSILASLCVSQAHADLFAGSAGPALASINKGSWGQSFQLTYKGPLFNDCKSGGANPEGNLVRVLFMLPSSPVPVAPFVRTMRYTCTTAINYNLPNQSVFSIYGFNQDPNLWNLLDLTQSTDGSHYEFDVAFEFQGQWDSNNGQNYHVILNKIPSSGTR